LFTIIVLGEVVFGVVDGLSSAERDAKTIATGMIALWLGFGLWWIYPAFPPLHASKSSTGSVFTTIFVSTPHAAARSQPIGSQSSCPE
jgi:hypothetical protein